MILHDSHANGLFWGFVGNFDFVGVGLMGLQVQRIL